MSSQIIEEQHKLTQNPQQVCRLCLSEEMLEDVFNSQQDEIIRQVSDLLSIVISKGDQISRSICAICRARLLEFHDYKLSCLEVQDVLRSQTWPAEEKDLSDADCEEKKSEQHDDLDTDEDLLEEMKITPENTEPDAETDEAEDTDEPKDNLPKSGQKRYIYDIKKNYVSCTKCRKKVLKSCLQAHQEKHRLPNYKCEHGCEGMKFECRQTQLQHHVDVHNIRPVKCKTCHKLFAAKSTLQYHNYSAHQSKQFHCTTCEGSFSTPYMLERHMKIHRSQKDFNCSKCGYATSVRHNLNRHMLMHERKEKAKKPVRARIVHKK